MAGRNWFFSLLSGIWRVLDGLRKTLHLIVLVALALMVLAVLTPAPPLVPSKAALLIAPEGDLVDELAGDAVSRAWSEVTGRAQPQTLARDLRDAIDAARDDQRIGALVLSLDAMGGAGLSTLQALGEALQRFKQSGKPVIAVADYFTQAQYYLASFADEIRLHPSGFVFVPGFGAYQTYFREALERLYIDWNVFKVGEYKSFVEPFTRDGMSDEARENTLDWLGDLWAMFQSDVTIARGLEEGALERYSNRLPEFMRDTRGDLGELALKAGLVDELAPRDTLNERVGDIVGIDESTHEFHQIHHAEYLRALHIGRRSSSDSVVAVVVASGDILDGRQPPGVIGGDSTAELISSLRYDERVKAVVLRIDSGGGSAFASEVIARQVELLRESGKPVVASMGDVAASGGYMIAMAADEVWARASSITGSIGIGAFFPTFQRSLDKLGVHVDGVGTTALAGQFRPDRELSEDAREILQLSIEHGYQRFISDVAAARDLPVERVDEIARGKVWLGREAQTLGLVDYLGDLEEAIDSAADLAGLEDYDVRYQQRELSFEEMLASRFASLAARVGLDLSGRSGWPLQGLVRDLSAELRRFAQWNDPRGLYYHCLCDL